MISAFGESDSGGGAKVIREGIGWIGLVEGEGLVSEEVGFHDVVLDVG